MARLKILRPWVMVVTWGMKNPEESRRSDNMEPFHGTLKVQYIYIYISIYVYIFTYLTYSIQGSETCSSFSGLFHPKKDSLHISRTTWIAYRSIHFPYWVVNDEKTIWEIPKSLEGIPIMGKSPWYTWVNHLGSMQKRETYVLSNNKSRNTSCPGSDGGLHGYGLQWISPCRSKSFRPADATRMTVD